MHEQSQQKEQAPRDGEGPPTRLETAQQPLQTNPRLMLIEALMFATIVVIGGLLTYELVGLRKPATPSPVINVPGMLEAEMLQVAEKVGDFNAMVQDTSTFAQGQWSGGKQFFAAARTPGDRLTMRLPGRSAGNYDLIAYLTKSFDYGVVQISVNGEEVGSPIDLWSYVVEPTGPMRLGRVILKGEGDVIRIEVVGKNQRSVAPFYQFGVDGFVFEPSQ